MEIGLLGLLSDLKACTLEDLLIVVFTVHVLASERPPSLSRWSNVVKDNDVRRWLCSPSLHLGVLL